MCYLYTIMILDRILIYTSKNILCSYFSKGSAYASLFRHPVWCYNKSAFASLLIKTFCLSKTQAYFAWSLDYFCK